MLNLQVDTARVERVLISAMNIVKNPLRSRIDDQWMNENLIVYIETNIIDTIDNNTVMQYFQRTKTRREQL